MYVVIARAVIATLRAYIRVYVRARESKDARVQYAARTCSSRCIHFAFQQSPNFHPIRRNQKFKLFSQSSVEDKGVSIACYFGK